MNKECPKDCTCNTCKVKKSFDKGFSKRAIEYGLTDKQAIDLLHNPIDSVFQGAAGVLGRASVEVPNKIRDIISPIMPKSESLPVATLAPESSGRAQMGAELRRRFLR